MFSLHLFPCVLSDVRFPGTVGRSVEAPVVSAFAVGSVPKISDRNHTPDRHMPPTHCEDLYTLLILPVYNLRDKILAVSEKASAK